jgi:hypothetical protein
MRRDATLLDDRDREGISAGRAAVERGREMENF